MLRPYISVASVAIAPNAPTANLTSVTTQQMICPGCRAEIPLGSAFCPACGNPSPTVITNERVAAPPPSSPAPEGRSEEHTSELQSRPHLVCRLLLEKKKTRPRQAHRHFVTRT